MVFGDTGATGCVITLKVINELGLISTGMTEVHTANGKVLKRTFDISLRLVQNNVLINGIIATEADALSGGCDALIGMDVISIGDFSITNYKGVTCMSFRTPSMHEIDYVKNLYIDNTKIVKISPDAPCPCKSKYSSGQPKPFKFCCGKN
jgi:predicted aspartyl protease